MSEPQCVCAEPEQSLDTGRCRFCGLNCVYLYMFRPEGKTKRQLVEERQAIVDRLEADLSAVEQKLYSALRTIHETPDVAQVEQLQRQLDLAQSLARYLVDHIDRGTTPGTYELQAARLYQQKNVSVRFRPSGESTKGIEAAS